MRILVIGGTGFIGPPVVRELARMGHSVAVFHRANPNPELPAEHPLVQRCVAVLGRPAGTAPYGTDASELQAIAPCVVLGPGDIAEAHTPTEKVQIRDLATAVPVFVKLAVRSTEG